MKKNVTIMLASVVLLSSCGTYAGSGAANGAYFGSLLGSAIGGLQNGQRGSDVGTILGMAGGAIIGAAIGDAQDKAVERDRQQYLEEKARLRENREAREARQNMNYDPTGSYDDRIDFDPGTDVPSSFVEYTTPVQSVAELEIRNIHFNDSNKDGILSRGETADIVFDIFNSSKNMAFDIEPTIIETTGNKHILVSPSILVESLAPHKGIRYTARVVADRTIKNGTAQFSIIVKHRGTQNTTPITINIPTSKR